MHVNQTALLKIFFKAAVAEARKCRHGQSCLECFISFANENQHTIIVLHSFFLSDLVTGKSELVKNQLIPVFIKLLTTELEEVKCLIVKTFSLIIYRDKVKQY